MQFPSRSTNFHPYDKIFEESGSRLFSGAKKTNINPIDPNTRLSKEGNYLGCYCLEEGLNNKKTGTMCQRFLCNVYKTREKERKLKLATNKLGNK